MIGTCTKCGTMYEGSDEDTSEPGATCATCHRLTDEQIEANIDEEQARQLAIEAFQEDALRIAKNIRRDTGDCAFVQFTAKAYSVTGNSEIEYRVCRVNEAMDAEGFNAPTLAEAVAKAMAFKWK